MAATDLHDWREVRLDDHGLEVYRCVWCGQERATDPYRADDPLPHGGCEGHTTGTRVTLAGRLLVSLYLDDERPAPPGWVRARTVDEVLAYLRLGVVEHLSLDHDLGFTDDSDPLRCVECKTGYDLVKAMAEENLWPTHKPIVHSANPAGAANMRSVIDRYGPYGGSREGEDP